MDIIDCNGERIKGRARSVEGACQGTPNGGMILHFLSVDMNDMGLC